MKQLEIIATSSNATYVLTASANIDGEAVPILKRFLEILLPVLPENLRKESGGELVRKTMKRQTELKPNELGVASRLSLFLSYFRQHLKVEDYREDANAVWDALAIRNDERDFTPANFRLAGLQELALWVSPDRAAKLPSYVAKLIQILPSDRSGFYSFDWKPLTTAIEQSKDEKLVTAALTEILTRWETVAESSLRGRSSKAVASFLPLIPVADRPALAARTLRAFLNSQERGEVNYLDQMTAKDLLIPLNLVPKEEATAFTRKLVTLVTRPDKKDIIETNQLRYRIDSLSVLKPHLRAEDYQELYQKLAGRLLAKKQIGKRTNSIDWAELALCRSVVPHLPLEQRRNAIRPLIMAVFDGAEHMNVQDLERWRQSARSLSQVLEVVDTDDLRTLLRHPYCITDVRDVVLKELRKRFPDTETDSHVWLKKLPPETKAGRFPFAEWGLK